MAGILTRLNGDSSPSSRKRESAPIEGIEEPLQKYSFDVCAVDGSAFTMEVLAPNLQVASRFLKRYPGIISFTPIRH